MTNLEALKQAVIDRDQPLARRLVDQELASGVPPQTVLAEALVPAMAVVGERFERGEYFVPDLLVAARAMKAALEPIRPMLARGDVRAAGRVVIGTVKGDLHDIGKNLVAAMLEGGGFHVVDLGVDVSPAAFVDAVRVHAPDIVGLSALLSTTVTAMKGTIQALEAAGVRGRVRVLVGGAPVSAAYARDIGADGYADNAGAAVTLARQMVGEGA